MNEKKGWEMLLHFLNGFKEYVNWRNVQSTQAHQIPDIFSKWWQTETLKKKSLKLQFTHELVCLIFGLHRNKTENKINQLTIN